MCQNALGESDCIIFKSTISLERTSEKPCFNACWYKFMEIKSLLKSIGVGMVNNGCGHSCHRTLKLDVSQDKINGIN